MTRRFLAGALVSVLGAAALLGAGTAPALAAPISPVITLVEGGDAALELTTWNGAAYFGTSSGLHLIDGDTSTLLDGSPSNPITFAEFGGDLWMIADAPDATNGLYRYDGTEFVFVSAAANNTEFIVDGGFLYFLGFGEGLTTLYRTDGTAVEAIAAEAAPRDIYEIAGTAEGIVILLNPAAPEQPQSLWTYRSATNASTAITGAPTDADELTSAAGGVAFSGGPDGNPWFTDGITATQLGTETDAYSFIDYTGSLAWLARNGSPEARLYGTTPPAPSGPAGPSFGNQGSLRFVASDGTLYAAAGDEDTILSTYDGTTLWPVGGPITNPYGDFTELNGTIFLIAQPEAETSVVWRLDPPPVVPVDPPVTPVEPPLAPVDPVPAQLAASGGPDGSAAIGLGIFALLSGAAIVVVTALRRRHPAGS